MAQNYEQQLKLLREFSLGFGIAALVLLAVAVFLFIWLNIPQVFREYRGRTTKTIMEEMEVSSVESGLSISSGKRVRNKKEGNIFVVEKSIVLIHTDKEI